MNRILTRCLQAGACALLATAWAAESRAQCDTCAAPAAVPVTVGYAPTVTLEPYNGWYPGKLLDRMRLRRWERTAARTNAATYTTSYAPTYTAAYAPGYTTGYAPTYTAAYAPTSYTAAYTPYTASYAYSASYQPYVSAYAPLQRNVQTTYYRAAVLSPVVAEAGCSSCDPCGGCSSCSTGVSQAAYGAPAGGCSSCAASAGTPDYGYDYGYGASGGVSGADYGQANEQPQMTAPPASTQYGTQRQPLGGAVPDEADPAGAGAPPKDPGPTEDDATDSEAGMYPRLLSPVNDRTANRPTVDVWNAVYNKPVATRQTSLRQPAPQRQRTQAEIDADPWHGVSR